MNEWTPDYEPNEELIEEEKDKEEAIRCDVEDLEINK